MNRKSRRSKVGLDRGLKRRALLDFERMEGRTLLTGMTYTVTNTNSSGSGSLFYEITQADSNTTDPSSPNVIHFDIASSGVQTIALTQQLPEITQPTDIDGYTEPGSSANTHPLTMGDNAVLTIVVSGEASIVDGLFFDASAAGSSVEGLDLVGFSNTAISVASNNTAVTGNFIGVGTNGVPTESTINYNGVELGGASGVSIGGTAAADRNVITGNSNDAVALGPVDSVDPTNDVIEGNFVGPNADLTLPTDLTLVNTYGVSAFPSAGITIGGTSAGSGNVIAGNAVDGIGGMDSLGLVIAGNVVQDNGSFGVILTSNPGALLTSNTIGGTIAQGNLGYGIDLQGSSYTTIGGTAAGAGNLIAGNGPQRGHRRRHVQRYDDRGLDDLGVIAASGSISPGIPARSSRARS